MPDSISTQINELREKNWTVRAISTHLHVATNTVFRYLDKDSFTKRSLGYIKSCERKRKRFLNQDEIKIGKIDPDTARLYAALLYWCEGSKYPSSSTLSFTTSDIQMQKLFITLFRKGFKPIESKFRVWLQLHDDQDMKKVFNYWSTNLKIPQAQFIKPRITAKKGGKYRRVYWGTCSLRYADYSKTLRLMGIYKRFYKQALKALI